MHIRTFRAANINDALRMIREEMGLDASILHTRRVESGLLGRFGRSRIEVTAGLKREKTESQSTRSGAVVAAEPPASTLESKPNAAVQEPRAHRMLVEQWAEHGALESEARYWMHQASVLASQRNQSTKRNQYAGAFAASAQRPEVEEFGFEGVDVKGGVDFAGDEVERIRHDVTSWMAGQLHTRRPLEELGGSQKIVSLIGATGVGKTTTIAKIAAGIRLERAGSVGLLTLDQFRAAAVEQLQCYADAMKVPLHVAQSHEDIRRGLQAMSDLDLILVDTVGQSPFGTRSLAQLELQLEDIHCDETLLVLDANTSRASTRACIDAFQRCKPTATIISKADQVRQPSGLFSPLVELGLPLTYVTTGQMVPHDICLAEAATLASWCSGLAVMVAS